LFACVVGELWQLYGSWGVLGVFALSLRFPALARFNPLRGLFVSAYTGGAHFPWYEAWLGSALLAALCCFGAVRILDRKEY
jgi:hypothetical protein